MRRGLLLMPLLLTGCEPPIEETVLGVGVVALFLIGPLLLSLILSILSAWALVAAQEVRRGVWPKSSVVWPAVSGVFWAGVNVLLCVLNTHAIAAEQAQPEAEPLQWLVWPAPLTPAASVLLALSALWLVGLGAWTARTSPGAGHLRQDVGSTFD